MENTCKETKNVKLDYCKLESFIASLLTLELTILPKPYTFKHLLAGYNLITEKLTQKYSIDYPNF